MKIAHQLTENVKFLHKVALVHQGKVLVLKRAANAKSRPGAWDLPGGNAEWPAELTTSKRNVHQEDIAREVIEETGFEVLPAVFSLENMVHFFSYFDERKQVYSIVCGWVVSNLTDLDPDKVLLSDEHTEYRWIELDELASLDFGEPVGRFVKTIIENSLDKFVAK
ncbi:MAG: NUDIX domain-containing protein [Patescibacteria group bacterium]